MAVPEGYHDMQSTAALSGLTPGVIRMWEARYGWPHPRRMPNGYRVYTPAQVDELRRAGAAVRAGTPIRQLVDKDGNLAMPRAPGHRPLRPRLDGLRVLIGDGYGSGYGTAGGGVLAALERLDAAPVVAALVGADRVHPEERRLLWRVVVAALADVAAQGYNLPGREKVERALAGSMRDPAKAAGLLAS